MGNIASQFATAFRDFVTDGVASSGPHEVIKEEVRAIGPLIETALGTLSLGSVDVVKDTRSNLNADLAHAADSTALVYGDATDANNDLYIKVGASGSGSWTLTTILHDVIGALVDPKVALAEEWAENPEDDEITGNPGSYSSLHHSAKASEQRALTETLASDISANSLAFVRSAQNLRKSNARLALAFGGSSYTTGLNYTAFARAYLCGTDFPAGSFIDGLRFAGQAAYMVATIYERAPDAPNLNAAPGAVGDVVVAVAAVTQAQYRAAGFCVPTPRYAGRAGYYYFAAVECFAADGTTRAATAMLYATGSDGPQWQEGFIRVGSAAWSNHATTRYLSVGLITATATETVTSKLDAAYLATLAQQTSDFRQMVVRNLNSLRGDCSFDPLGTGLVYRLSGDSLAFQNTSSPARTSTQVLTTLSPGITASNIGVNGHTSAQILAALTADNTANPARAGGTNISNASNNDENVATYATTRTNVDSIIATFTGQWVFATGGSEAAFATPKQRRLFQELRAIHGARIWDWDAIWRQNEANATDARLTGDGVHFNSLGTTLMGFEQTRLFRAMNGGAPYVHEEVLPLRANDAAGTSIGSGLILGTPTQVYRTAGDNSDNAIAINASTGAITRGAGAPSALIGSRELIIKATNFRGGHENRKTFLMAQDTGDTMPRYDIEFLGEPILTQCPYLVPVDATNTTVYPVLANTTKLSFVMFLRVTSGMSGGIIGSAGILTTGTTFTPRLIARNTSAVAVGGGPSFPVAPDPFALNAFFVSVDTEAGAITIATNEVSSTISITADSIPIDLSTLIYLFGSTGAPLAGCAMRRLMMFHGHAFDFTNAAKRALFYDPVTNLPINTSGATVDGQTAILDIYGRPFDWNRGINRGSLGNLLPARWNGMERMGIREL